MMHGAEKSDSSTVAKKSANKPRSPGAESMERREGTKENTGESPAKPDAEPGNRHGRAGACTASSTRQQDGAVHGVAAPCDGRSPVAGVSLAQAQCRPGGRRCHLVGL